MEAKKMKFLILIAPGTTVHGSQQLIYSIFRNLTDNAIAYAGEGTTITVQCLKEEKNKLWFSFSDNGAGVPPEHLTHLFESARGNWAAPASDLPSSRMPFCCTGAR